MRNAVYHLPPFKVGPYAIQVQPRARVSFPDKRYNREIDWNAGVAYLREGLSPDVALRALMRCVVSAIHYRSGLNDTCDEEAFTHSLASGLVELADTSPRFWFELHQVLDQRFGRPDFWAEAAGGAPTLSSAVQCPSALKLGHHRCPIQWVPAHLWSDRLAYGLYTPVEKVIELPHSLQGGNRPLVILHESLHFLHEVLGLTDSHDEQTFKRRQADGLLRFWKQNPEFWRWWLVQLSESTKQMWALAA